MVTPGEGKHRGSSVLYNFLYYLIYPCKACINSVLRNTFDICVSFLQVKDSFALVLFG